MSADNSRPKRILIIDDSEVLLARMKRAMVTEGYDVITTTQIVGNARHLVTCDLIIVDYHMPGLNGSSVVQSMRTVVQSSKHRCAFYVYSSDQSVLAQHAQLGFDGAFVSKGDENQLIRQLAAYFRLAAMKTIRGAESKEK